MTDTSGSTPVAPSSPSGALPRLRLAPYLARGLSVLAAFLGLMYGYVFGDEVGGPALGILLGLNGAVFCALMVASLIDRVAGWLGRRL